MYTYQIINATNDEREIIDEIIKYIDQNYHEKISVFKLEIVEVVDKLSNGSSGRALRTKMYLVRENGIDVLKGINFTTTEFKKNDDIKEIIGTIYHELWHISTWDLYSDMYEFVLDESNDSITAFAYMYWIEFIAHIETVFMEVPSVMRKFCENFINRQWQNIVGGYSYFVKALPYFIVRARYLGCFEKLAEQIMCRELRNAVYEFESVSYGLLNNDMFTENEKAMIIKDKVKKLFS